MDSSRNRRAFARKVCSTRNALTVARPNSDSEKMEKMGDIARESSLLSSLDDDTYIFWILA